MALESDDKVYKSKIKNLNTSIQAEREKLNKMNRMFSGASDAEIEATRKSIRDKQTQLTKAQQDYDVYTKTHTSDLDADQAVFFTDSEVTKGTYDYNTGTYTKTSDSSDASSTTGTSSSSGSTASSKSSDSISNSIVGTVTGAVDSATDTIKGIAGSAANTVNGVVNNATNFVSNLANTAEQAISKATAGLSNAVTGIKNGISKLFSSDDSSEKKALTSKTTDKGPAETDTKVKTLEANSNEAVSKPVAFTSAETKVVTNPTKSAETQTKDDSLPKTGKLTSALSSLKKGIGKTISTVTGAVKSVTSNFKKAINTAKTAINKVKSAVNAAKKAIIEPIASTVKAINTTVKNAVASVKNFAKPFIDGYHEVIDGTKGFINDIADALPGPLGAKLKSKADSFIENKIEAKVETKLAAFNNALDKISGLGLKGNVKKIYDKLLNYESSSDNAHDLINSNGESVSELYGDNAAGSVTGLYDAAHTVCPSVTTPDITDKAIGSREYGILLMLAAENGMADLIDQMGACGKSTGYFSDASRSSLVMKLPEIAATGDVNTYTSVFNLVGKNNVVSPGDDIRTLIANTKNVNDVIMQRYKWLAKQSGYDDVEQLCTTDTGLANIKAYDMNKVSFMTCSNTKVMDSCLGKANRTLIQALRVTR